MGSPKITHYVVPDENLVVFSNFSLISPKVVHDEFLMSCKIKMKSNLFRTRVMGEISEALS